MSLWKKIHGPFLLPLFAAFFFFTLGGCFGSGTSSNLGIGNFMQGGGGENAATDPTTDTTSRENGNGNNAQESADETDQNNNVVALSRVLNDPGTGGPTSVRPGANYPDPLPNVAGCTLELDVALTHDKDVCIVSNDQEGKRVKVKLKAALYLKCPPTYEIRLRIVDKKDHQFLDTENLHKCANAQLNEAGFGCVTFTMTTFASALNPPNKPVKITAYVIPAGFEPNQPNVELPCEEGHCHFKDAAEFPLLFTPPNLSEVAANASQCSANSDDD